MAAVVDAVREAQLALELVRPKQASLERTLHGGVLREVMQVRAALVEALPNERDLGCDSGRDVDRARRVRIVRSRGRLRCRAWAGGVLIRRRDGKRGRRGRVGAERVPGIDEGEVKGCRGEAAEGERLSRRGGRGGVLALVFDLLSDGANPGDERAEVLAVRGRP